MKSSANNTMFVITTVKYGAWPQVCTFDVDYNYNNNELEGPRLVSYITMWNVGGIKLNPYKASWELPWGFLIGKDERQGLGKDGRRQYKWTIKAITKQQSPGTGSAPFSMRMEEVWSVPTEAWSDMAHGRLLLTEFAEWAESRGFETISAF
jgi:hypothetical protein